MLTIPNMEFENALHILYSLSAEGGCQTIDIKRNPRAIGSMGLAPFEIEQETVSNARATLNEYLSQFPEKDRDGIKQRMWEDYRDIQSVKGAGIDLSFFDRESSEDEFPRLSVYEYQDQISRLKEIIEHVESTGSLYIGGPIYNSEKRHDHIYLTLGLQKDKEKLATLEREYQYFFGDK